MPAARADTADGAARGLTALARKLAGLSGWRGAVVAAGLGVVSAGALPPLYLLPLLWLAFPGLLWLLDGAAGWRRAFVLGWAFGAGHFAAGLYWVGHAFLVDAAQFGAVMPLAVAALAGGMALFPALTLVAVWFSRSRGLARVLFLAGAWVAAEWLRSWVLTGFPWNLIGSVWTFADAPMQLAALAGVWGLGLVTVIAAAAPACLAEPPADAGPRRRPPSTLALALALALPGLLWAGGEVRLMMAPGLGEAIVEGSLLRLVQPSIEQKNKWQSDLRAAHVSGQMAMSVATPDQPVTHVIWSETAVPFLLAEETNLQRDLAKIVPPGGVLVTGAPRREVVDGEMRLWNTLFVIDPSGEATPAYDKRHLVPFGEYLPLRSLFGFAKLTAGRLDFSPGEGPRVLRLPGLPPASPLICYETIFPGRVVDRGAGTSWLLNITNDAWFGVSSGPYQHLASARLRAVEEGLPLVRVANSGISAVIDGYGRVVGRLELNRVGVLDLPLPRAVEKRTTFSRLGNWSLLILLGIAFSLRFAGRRFA